MKPIELKSKNPKSARAKALVNISMPMEDLFFPKFDVTERKKADIDALTNEVLDNQGQVDQLQAIVTSLTGKSNKLKSQLNDAKDSKAIALSNNELGEEVVNNARDLMENSGKTYDQVLESEMSIKRVSENINNVINKLIYSVEVINKLSALIAKKKTSNPLISDELIAVITEAGTNANNAVSLTMVALKSVFASQATISEAESSLALEFYQSVKLLEYIFGKKIDEIDSELPETGVKKLLQESYETAVFVYDRTLEAYQDVQNQLDSANYDLNQAQIRLASSEAGLAAANAAALAS